jgi:hypothetical protein
VVAVEGERGGERGTWGHGGFSWGFDGRLLRFVHALRLGPGAV